jgi:hypothetical protein
MFRSFEEAVYYWEDSALAHTVIFKEFYSAVDRDPQLKAHRDFVEQNNFGFGDRPFHWMWNLVVQALPPDFKFLEIGVFQGQIISLVSMLSKRYDKPGRVFALTPLKPVGDSFCQYIDVDYRKRIEMLYTQFNLDPASVTFYEGVSSDELVIAQAQQNSPYNAIYIDGGHDYETVVNDIEIFSGMLATNGLLIMDDSADHLNIPDGLIPLNWRGILDVSNAVRDKLESNQQFNHIFSCGHNRIWQKIA